MWEECTSSLSYFPLHGIRHPIFNRWKMIVTNERMNESIVNGPHIEYSIVTLTTEYSFYQLAFASVVDKTMSRTSMITLLLLGSLQLFGDAFVIPSNNIARTSSRQKSRPSSLVFMSDENEEDRLSTLGYSKDEIRRSRKEPSKERQNVRVDIAPNVDASTLTAVGFGLIAFNFFVLANMGDGGIGGVVATIINTLNQ
jgi:hypothetical protein